MFHLKPQASEQIEFSNNLLLCTFENSYFVREPLEMLKICIRLSLRLICCCKVTGCSPLQHLSASRKLYSVLVRLINCAVNTISFAFLQDKRALTLILRTLFVVCSEDGLVFVLIFCQFAFLAFHPEKHKSSLSKHPPINPEIKLKDD
jgi:hypothetical protein